MIHEILLIPRPRRLAGGESLLKLPSRGFVAVQSEHARELHMAAKCIQAAARRFANLDWQISAGPSRGTSDVVSLSIDSAVTHAEGYRLSIADDGIRILGHDAAGVFYGAQTLVQLLRQFGAHVPKLEIDDWPDFRCRGYMQDISRDKVPTRATLYALVDQLAGLKINQLQLYTEHTFAYRDHPVVWAQASPMTGEEILALDAYCKERFIDLVPNQNSFGHMERWLKHPQYHDLAECPDGFTFPWGAKNESGFTINPLDPRSLALIEGLFDELLPHFQSKLFNVGCDETFDLGLGKCKAECEKRGKERVYLDFLLKIHRAITERGKQMQFWGDIILHKPELIKELPKDLIALNWGYDHKHPFEKETKAFADAGVPFYVAPGTSSWLSIAGRTDNAIANLHSAAKHGVANGAIGYLNTDWGDYGHLQYLPVSFLALAAGAAFSWCLASNESLASNGKTLTDAVSLHLFQDPTGAIGQVAFDLGNVYQAMKEPLGNSTRLFWTLVGGEDRKRLYEKVPIEEFEDAQGRISQAVAPLNRAKMHRSDAALVRAEFENAAAMLSVGCRRGKYLVMPSKEVADNLASDYAQILGKHRELWLARNRIGGLNDSTRRLEQRMTELGAPTTGGALS